MSEKILVVDEHDNVIGEEDKEKCHDGKGILHRAFVAIVLNEKNEAMLAKRADSKRLWPGYWDCTIASHLHKGEDYLSASKRRMREELGASCENFRMIGKFRYTAKFKGDSENEICAIIICNVKEAPNPDRNEISEIKYIKLSELLMEPFKKNYAPWMVLALQKISRESLL